MSAFGGIVAVNRPVTAALAEALAPVFTEVVVAPAFDDDALEVLAGRRRTCACSRPHAARRRRRSTCAPIDGGLLVQTADAVHASTGRRGTVVTERSPTDDEWADLEFAWQVVRHGQLERHRAGQGRPGRRHRRRPAEPASTPARIAAEKAAGRAAGGACA